MNTRSTWSGGRFRLGWILIAIASLNALGWTLVRWQYENEMRRTQLTVDYDDTRTLADAYQLPHAQLLRELKKRGVTSVGLYDQALANFRDNGRLTLTPREEAERLYPDARWADYPPAYRFLVTASRENQSLLGSIMPRLREQSQPSLPPKVVLLRDAQSVPAAARNPATTSAATPRGSAARRGTTRRAAPRRVTHSAQFGILIPASRQLVSDALLGFDPAQVKAVRDAGMLVTARVSNSLNLNLERVRLLLDDAARTGARVVIFSEDEVLGYDSLIKEVADRMQARNLVFGNIEFTKQRGWQDFAKNTGGALVRVHSVGGEEAAKVKVEMLVDRYARAVKERDIRVAYIRLVRQFKGGPVKDQAQANRGRYDSALQQNLDFVEQVSRELRAQPVPSWLRPGLTMGGASAFGDYPIDWLAARLGGARANSPNTMHNAQPLRSAEILRYFGLFLSGLGAVGAVLLLLNLFFDLSHGARLGWLALGVLIVAALSFSPGMGAKIMALVVGCTFSVIGILWGGLPRVWDAARGNQQSEIAGADGATDGAGIELKPGRVFLEACGVLIKTSLLTMLGGLLIIALLNHWKFMSKADEFLGEKATQMLPLFIVGLAFAGEVFPHRVAAGGATAARARARDRFLDVLKQPFTVRVAVTLAVLFVAGGVWIARTGNDSGMEISSFELKMRAVLEQVFITRPRTKEIFLGMPAMILAVWFARQNRFILTLGAAVLATMGMADVINTFCHIHTPIFYSLLRSIHGVWLGALIGGLALWLFNAIERRVAGRLRPIQLTSRRDEETPSASETLGAADGDINGSENGSAIGTIFVPGKSEEARR